VARVWVERVDGAPFVELADGRVAAQARLAIENETDGERRYTVALVAEPDLTARLGQASWRVAARRSVTVPLVVEAPRGSFAGGRRVVRVRIDGDDGFAAVVPVTLIGPSAGGGAP
jgi:hypothetical protein